MIYAPMSAGVQELLFDAGVGVLGGVIHGILVKSKNSSRFDCAA